MISMSDRFDFTTGSNTSGALLKNSQDGYRIYILGNFSGESLAPEKQWTIKGVDIDNFEQVMSQIRPTLKVDEITTLQFESVDDFHPDTLLKNLPDIAEIQQLKTQLGNSNTALQAAEKLQSLYKTNIAPEANLPSLTENTQAESSDDMLQRLLGKSSDKSSHQQSSVNQLISKIMAPYIVEDTNPQYSVYSDAIDATISQYLQCLLHTAKFQQLEALWRSTEMLVNEEASDEQTMFLVDISQTVLLSELTINNSPFEQQLMNHIQLGDDEQDVLFLGNYSFSNGIADNELLKHCSQLAKNCQGIFIGGANKALIDNLVLPEATLEWSQYLNDLCQDNLMLAYPSYLLRLPYGKKRDPIESFSFEEYSSMSQEEELLWGNPAFLCTRALIRSNGDQQTQDHLFFEDIYSFTINVDAEDVLHSSTQSSLNRSQSHSLLSKGIIPLISFRQRQGVQVLTLLALSESA